ncbi:MAG: hypothetical protein U5O39_12965 [Gammaproteobacteria bacterium]|nr:hypothetical protein [Gammaproteobacteria bacterium]
MSDLILLHPDELVSSRQQDHLAGSADVFVMARFRELLEHRQEVTSPRCVCRSLK